MKAFKCSVCKETCHSAGVVMKCPYCGAAMVRGTDGEDDVSKD